MTTPDPQVFPIDLGSDDAEIPVSHIIKLGTVEIRCLAEPQQWNLLKTTADPMYIFRAYVHPDDWAVLDSYMASRRSLPQDAFTMLATAIVEKPTGHPTTDSSASSDI